MRTPSALPRASRSKPRAAPARSSNSRPSGSPGGLGEGGPRLTCAAVARTILSAFTVPDIRKKLLFTAAVLALYRLGSHIPVPGVNTSAVTSIQKNFGGSDIPRFLQLFSGGGVLPLFLVALGIQAYITA